MRQLLPRLIKPSAANGHVLTTVAGKSAWAAPSAGGGSGGGSGGGASGRDLRWTVPATWESLDEFNDDTIDAAWSRVDSAGPASNVEWVELGDVLSVSHKVAGSSGAGAVYAWLQAIGAPVDVGDAFVTCANAFAARQLYPQVGIVLSTANASGAGEQVRSVHQHTAAGDHTAQAYISSTTGFTTQPAYSAIIDVPKSGWIYQRLAYIAANTWRSDFSPDGVTWVQGATFTKTMSPAYVGVYIGTGGTNQAGWSASFEFLRRVSGVS